MSSNKNKAQGMYPTPAALAKLIVGEALVDISKIGGLLEPSAGYGVFILEAWSYLLNIKRLSKSQMNTVVENTFAFENDEDTFLQLKLNLSKWCKDNGVQAKAKILKKNFLLEISNYKNSFPDNLIVLGNPPWDEFTTRKHDATGTEAIRAIRIEREREKAIFSPLGIKNLYQAFVYCLLEINTKNLQIAFVLPRQILGDMASSDLRKRILDSGNINVTVYKNKDEKEFFFEAVDGNFEIAILYYNSFLAAGKRMVSIRRGFNASYNSVQVNGSDYTIPCPPENTLFSTLEKVLGESTMGSWVEKWGISVSRGKVTSESIDYQKSANGRTIKAYQIGSAIKNSRLVLNKILPNSKRKIKAAILSSKSAVSDSLVMVNTEDKTIYPYLVLMLNSRAVELALWSLTSNINLNNFRLLSLPIPEPDDKTLRYAATLFNKCVSSKLSWETASDELTQEVFSLSQRDQKSLASIFPERETEYKENLAAA